MTPVTPVTAWGGNSLPLPAAATRFTSAGAAGRQQRERSVRATAPIREQLAEVGPFDGPALVEVTHGRR
jgi:hypothetical protein